MFTRRCNRRDAALPGEVVAGGGSGSSEPAMMKKWLTRDCAALHDPFRASCSTLRRVTVPGGEPSLAAALRRPTLLRPRRCDSSV